MPQTVFFIFFMLMEMPKSLFLLLNVTRQVRKAKKRSYAVSKLKMKQYAVHNGGRGYSPYSISSSSMYNDYICLFNVQLIVVERFEWYSKSISICNIIYPSIGLQYLVTWHLYHVLITQQLLCS